MLPESGLGPQKDHGHGGGQNGTQYSRRVGFDTFQGGLDLEGKEETTGGGTGTFVRSLLTVQGGS